MIETVRSTDVQIPPPEYYRIVRDACDRHGALLILDEIPICLGRTGRMFAFEHYDIVPDMVVIGKGLGGAVFPMAALIARRDLDIAADRALGHYTHEKSSVGAAAALATLEVIEDEEPARAVARARRSCARSAARDARRGIAIVADVRGIGLLLGVELARDGVPARREAEQVMYECLARGLSFKVGQGNVLTLSPPLVIAREISMPPSNSWMRRSARSKREPADDANTAQPARRRVAPRLGHAHRAHRASCASTAARCAGCCATASTIASPRSSPASGSRH